MKKVSRPVFAAALATVMLSSVGSGMAGAATPAGDAVPRAHGGSVVSQDSAKKGDAIKCELKAHQPHYSHHADQKVRHRVNTVATVTCEKSVSQVSMRVGLYKNNTVYKRSGVETVQGKKFAKQNASRRCVKKQNYAGLAKASIIFPPGYSPRTAKITASSGNHKIYACKKK